jgi:hypothetical protein
LSQTRVTGRIKPVAHQVWTHIKGSAKYVYRNDQFYNLYVQPQKILLDGYGRNPLPGLALVVSGLTIIAISFLDATSAG